MRALNALVPERQRSAGGGWHAPARSTGAVAMLPEVCVTERILLLETHPDAGGTARTWLERGASGVGLRREGFGPAPEFLALVPGAVQRVMLRYGGVPSEELVGTIEALAPELRLEDESTLASFRFRPRYDVIAKDYVVWRPPDASPRLELAVSVAAALTHLARAAQALGR